MTLKIIHNDIPSSATIQINWSNESNISSKIFGFEGEKKSQILIGDQLYVGFNGANESDDWREIGYSLGNYIKSLKIETIGFNTNYVEKDISLKAFFEGLYLSTYSFDKYKKPKVKEEVKFLLPKDEKINVASEYALIVTDSQMFVRDLVNTPFADAPATKIAKMIDDRFNHVHDVHITKYTEKMLKDENMNGHFAVGRASKDESMTLELRYEPKGAKKTIILVGKGLVYDTGGLSLKPATSMTTMKADKAGAITVAGIIDAASKLKLKVNIIGYMCFADNAIGPDAYRPDDILTMKNGKTVHVKNTDAEGRIVLFDNLCLAQEKNKDFDEIYTLATLTGAAVAAFGDEATAMVGYNKKMKKKIRKAGKKAGEVFVDAPFNKYMLDGVNDTVADLTNTGSKNMGCQKGGLFLTHAITDENKDKYIHLDIAGPAFVDKAFGTNTTGATGCGVRTLIKHLENISN